VRARVAQGEQAVAARILSGNLISNEIYAELAGELAELRAAGIQPRLAAVLVGGHSASRIYVRNKIAACEKLGLASELESPSASISTDELIEVIAALNRRDEVDGILVQLPLPPQVDAKRVLEAIDPSKDVDGFHPANVGRLVAGRPSFVPCTPAGIMEILRRSDVPIEGAEAVVVGRSDIVGKPTALLLVHANATVTVCHSKTKRLSEVTRRGDIVVAALGRPAMLTPDFIRPGSTVIDVGINRVTDAAEAERLFTHYPERLAEFRSKGSALVGDVHPDVAQVASALTPVPGGVGPLTVAMLMRNTILSARCRRQARAAQPAASKP